MRFVVSYVEVVFRNVFSIDTHYELIVGGHIYAVQPVVVMLQVVRVVVHGIFIRPSELTNLILYNAFHKIFY